MPYRDMARDAGYDPDTDEGQQMAEMLEAEAEMESHQQAWEAEQEWEAEQRDREEDEMEGEP